jgi:hypothetical protein
VNRSGHYNCRAGEVGSKRRETEGLGRAGFARRSGPFHEKVDIVKNIFAFFPFAVIAEHLLCVGGFVMDTR